MRQTVLQVGPFLRRRRADLLAVGVLFGVAAIFFAPVLIGGQWLPRGGGDNVAFLYPMYRNIAATLRSGTLPLWNPHQYAGFYQAGDNQSGIFYPPNLLLFLLNPAFSYRTLQLWVIGHLLWAGCGAYALARGWRTTPRIAPPAALIAGVSFMLSDLFIVHLGNYNLIAVIAWLPWALLALQRAVNAVSAVQARRRALLAGLLLGIGALAGHGQMTFLSALLAGLYALFAALATRRLRPLWLLAISGGVALGVAAVNIVPALAWQAVSLRAGFTADQTVNYSLPWAGLVGLFAPGFFGRHAAEFWGDWPRVEYGYVGTLPLLLATVVWLLPARRDRQAPAFFSLAALLTLLLALGSNTPLHGWLIAPLGLPFQVPARFVVLTDLALALLAAIGAQRLATDTPGRRWWGVGGALLALLAALLWLSTHYPDRLAQTQLAVLAFGALALLGWLLVALHSARRLTWPLFAALAVALTAADLTLLGWRTEIDANNPTAGFDHPTAIDWLQREAGINRIDVATGVWQPGTAQTVGLYDVGGVFNPLALAAHHNYMASVGFRGSPQYSALGIKYIVAAKTEPPGDTAFLAPVFNQDPAVDIWLNTRALPRVWLAYRSVVVADYEAAFAALHSGNIDLAQTAIVEHGIALDGAPAAHAIGIDDYRPNRVALTVETAAPAYLVLSDSYYHEWRATVNGTPQPIVRANSMLRAVWLPAGRHSVVMTFRPPSFIVGAAISALTLVGCGVALRRRSAERAP